MLKLPMPILNYLQALVVKERSPAYLLVNQDGTLLQWGGELEAYGIKNLQQGGDIKQVVLFLEGVLPIGDCPVFLPCVKTDDNFCADVHIFSSNEGNWILLLNAPQATEQILSLQQDNNNLSLLWQHQLKTIENSNQALSDIVTFQVIGECKQVTVLAVEIREICSSNYAHPITFNTLNLYLLAIIESILSEAGMVSNVFGETVTSLFGIVSASALIPQNAIKAAFKITKAVKEINRQHNLPQFGIAIGVASGVVLLSILHNQADQRISAIGHPVNLALHLKSYAGSGEILVDETTFHQLSQMQQNFSESTLTQVNDIKTYSCLLS